MSSKISAVDRLSEVPTNDLQFRTRAELETLREELRTERDNSFAAMERITHAAAGRPMTAPQLSDFNAADKRTTQAMELLPGVEDALALKAVDFSQVLSAGTPLDGPGARAALVGSRERYAEGQPLTRDQSFSGFVRSQGMVRHGEEELSFGRYIRGAVTGDWRNADAERRAMSEGVLSGGGYSVPTILSAQVIDKARNRTRVIEGGAVLFPMASQTVDLARWEGDPTPGFRAENATIAATDGVLGRVRLIAKSLAGVTVVSRELLEDAANMDAMITEAFAAQFAITVDRVALYGSGTSSEPTGVKLTSGITNRTMPASGVIEDYNFVIDSVGDLRDANENPTAVLMSPRTERKLGQLRDTTAQPMLVPPYLDGLPRLSTNQIPNNLGAGTNASDLFTGDWSQLLIGVRSQLQISILTERYAENGQVGILCWWRGDIAVARPKAFCVTTGIL